MSHEKTPAEVQREFRERQKAEKERTEKERRELEAAADGLVKTAFDLELTPYVSTRSHAGRLESLKVFCGELPQLAKAKKLATALKEIITET
jgi:hypothetical protein